MVCIGSWIELRAMINAWTYLNWSLDQSTHDADFPPRTTKRPDLTLYCGNLCISPESGRRRFKALKLSVGQGGCVNLFGLLKGLR